VTRHPISSDRGRVEWIARAGYQLRLTNRQNSTAQAVSPLPTPASPPGCPPQRLWEGRGRARRAWALPYASWCCPCASRRCFPGSRPVENPYFIGIFLEAFRCNSVSREQSVCGRHRPEPFYNYGCAATCRIRSLLRKPHADRITEGIWRKRTFRRRLVGARTGNSVRLPAASRCAIEMVNAKADGCRALPWGSLFPGRLRLADPRASLLEEFCDG
jgi:hypothetical protein